MNELDLIIDLHRFNERQGPGSQEDTLRALQFCDLLDSDNLRIADIGSGTGAQTLTLAQHLKGKITAIDLFDEFLNDLEKRKSNQQLGCEIEVLQASMDELPFEAESLDLIWSEGAIYNIGFEKGANYWNQFIKPEGYLAVSEITWITNHRPNEIDEFWKSEYPEIATASEKIRILETAGYSLRGYFKLSESSWIDSYYQQLSDQFEAFLQRHENSKEANEIEEESKREIELYQTFKQYYSYGFYVAQKTD